MATCRTTLSDGGHVIATREAVVDRAAENKNAQGGNNQ